MKISPQQERAASVNRTRRILYPHIFSKYSKVLDCGPHNRAELGKWEHSTRKFRIPCSGEKSDDFVFTHLEQIFIASEDTRNATTIDPHSQEFYGHNNWSLFLTKAMSSVLPDLNFHPLQNVNQQLQTHIIITKSVGILYRLQ